MYQGLGQAYINVFFWLTMLSFMAAVVLVLVVRRIKRIHAGWCMFATLILGTFFAFFAHNTFHYGLFVREHQRHNTLVPRTGCERYEPSFGYLFAAYRMSRGEFLDWVDNHPWQLAPYNQALLEHDEKRLGFTQPELSYATEMGANGGQLRVYFKDGIMYLSYNVM